MKAQRKKYDLKHCVTATTHAAMGDTLKKVALNIFEIIFEFWGKSQVVVALTRTKKGKDIIFVGNKQETIEAIIKLYLSKNQCTNYM